MSQGPWLCLPLLLAYATALWWCWQMWWLDDGYFAHQPLVPLVMVAICWSRRREWARRPAGIDGRGWWLLGPALLLHLVGAALTIDSLSAASLVLAVPGASWLALGRERLRGLWPVLWLAALAVPLPIYVTGQLAFELKELAVRGGVTMAQWSGLAVAREGAYLHVPGVEGVLDVADPCGGLRSLLAMVTLTYCVAFFLGPARWGRRVGLLAVAAPVALVVNMMRIAAICHAARWQGVEFAAGTGHDVLNGIAWVVDLAVILGLDAWWSARASAPVRAPLPVAVGPACAGGALRRQLLACSLCALPLLWLSLYRPVAESRDRAAALPAIAGAFVQQEAFEMTDRFFALLGTSDAIWRSYVAGRDDPAYVVAVFHGTNWKSVHPPHVCLLGSDMDLLEDGEVMLRGDDRIGRIVLRGRGDGRAYVSLYAYAATGLCSGSYWTFFAHHAPRALFRTNSDGFLLRVEAYADGDGGLAAAEQRCRDLLTTLLDAGLELLR